MSKLKSNFVNNSFPPKIVDQKIAEIKDRKFEKKSNNIDRFQNSKSTFKLFLDFTSKRCEKVLKPVKKETFFGHKQWLNQLL